MTERTVQDLLQERRALVIEATRERDAIARGVLEYYIADIDRELARRRG